MPPGCVEAKVAPPRPPGWRQGTGAELLGHPGQQVLEAQVLGQGKGALCNQPNTRGLVLLGTESEMESRGCERGSERPAPTAWEHCGVQATVRGAPKWDRGTRKSE